MSWIQILILFFCALNGSSKVVEKTKLRIVATTNSVHADRIFGEFGPTSFINDKDDVCNPQIPNRYRMKLCTEIYIEKENKLHNFIKAECKPHMINRLNSKKESQNILVLECADCELETQKVIKTFLVFSTPQRNYFYTAERNIGGKTGWTVDAIRCKVLVRKNGEFTCHSEAKSTFKTFLNSKNLMKIRTKL